MCVLIAVDMGTLSFLLHCELFSYKPRRENLPYPIKQCLSVNDRHGLLHLLKDGCCPHCLITKPEKPRSYGPFIMYDLSLNHIYEPTRRS